MFVVFPMLQTVYISLLSDEGQFVGLANYFDVLGRSEIVNLEGFSRGYNFGALIHNVMWIAIHLPLCLFSGLALAIILRDVKGSSIVKSAVYLGMVTPMIVGGIILLFTFTEGVGIVNGVFSMFGFEQLTRTWTAHPETALFSVIFGSVWLWTGFSMILYSAGLATIPKDYYEAARIDGASAFRTFFYITLPLLKPITITVVTMTILWELKIFDIVWAAFSGTRGVGGSANVLALQMYLYMRSRYFNDAAVVATFLTGLTVIVAVWMIRYMVKK